MPRSRHVRSIRMMMIVETGEGWVVMVAAVVRMRTVRMLVACVARRRGWVDRGRLVRRVMTRRRLGASGACQCDEPERAGHGFFFGGAEAIFCLSAASSSSRVVAA